MRNEGSRLVPMACESLPDGGAWLNNEILTDFKIGRFHLHTLAHFNYHQEHSDYLIVLNSRDDVEIGLFADNTLFGVLDFYPCATFGAWARSFSIPRKRFTMTVTALQPLVTAFHTGTHSVLQPITIVIDGRVECPVHLESGERAKSPTQFYYTGNAVSGSAGLDPYRLAALLRKETPLTALPYPGNASFATAKVKPSRLSQFPGDFVRYNKYNCELSHFCLV